MPYKLFLFYYFIVVGFILKCLLCRHILMPSGLQLILKDWVILWAVLLDYCRYFYVY